MLRLISTAPSKTLNSCAATSSGGSIPTGAFAWFARNRISSSGAEARNWRCSTARRCGRRWAAKTEKLEGRLAARTIRTFPAKCDSASLAGYKLGTTAPTVRLLVSVEVTDAAETKKNETANVDHDLAKSAGSVCHPERSCFAFSYETLFFWKDAINEQASAAGRVEASTAGLEGAI